MTYLAQRAELIATVREMIERGAISRGYFANLSLRIPGEDVILLTTPDAIGDIGVEDMAIVGLDNVVRSGFLRAAVMDIVPMHTSIYLKRPDVRAVLHSHAPHATAFAIANKPIPCAYIEMERYDLYDGVPVAAYAPRGSPESFQRMLELVGPKTSCLLLQNHGLVTYAADMGSALLLAIVLDEAAQMILLSEAIGGPTIIPRPTPPAPPRKGPPPRKR